jgi:surface antigen
VPVYPTPYYYDTYEPVVISRSPAYDWPDYTYRRQAYAQAFAAPVGESVTWNDADGSGTITTTRDGHSGDRYCREFVQEVKIDGKREKAYGAACQQPDGSWEIVPDNE